MLNNQNIFHRDETGYVNAEYSDTRPIYMPPVAKEMLKSIKSEKERQFDITPAAAIDAYDVRDAQRSIRWNRKFS